MHVSHNLVSPAFPSTSSTPISSAFGLPVVTELERFGGTHVSKTCDYEARPVSSRSMLA